MAFANFKEQTPYLGIVLAVFSLACRLASHAWMSIGLAVAALGLGIIGLGVARRSGKVSAYLGAVAGIVFATLLILYWAFLLRMAAGWGGTGVHGVVGPQKLLGFFIAVHGWGQHNYRSTWRGLPINPGNSSLTKSFMDLLPDR